MACIIKGGCGGIDGCCNVMHVFYGACEVIVGGDDGEAIGWCCCCEEFADMKNGKCHYDFVLDPL